MKETKIEAIKLQLKNQENTMSQWMWVYDPHSGGQKIPARIKSIITNRIERHAQKHYAGKYNRIDVRFRSHFCYIDAYTEPWAPENYDPKLFNETKEAHLERLRNTPTHPCRLRYNGDIER